MCFWMFPTTFPTTHKMYPKYNVLIPSNPFQHLTFGQVSSIIRRQQNNTASDKDLSFRQTFPPCLRLTNKLKKQAIFLFNFIMYHNIIFQVKGDISRHHLSIAGASVECGISVSTIYRSSLKGTFPPKVKLCEGRVAFLVYQIEEWLQGKRGGWV